MQLDVPTLKRRLLKTTAIPTVNLPTPEQSDEAERKLEAAESQRLEKRLQLKEKKNKRQTDQDEMVIKQEPVDPISIDNGFPKNVRQEDQDEIVIKHEPVDPISEGDCFPNVEDFASNSDIPPAKKKYAKKKKKKDVHDPLVDPLMQTDETEGLGKENKTKRKGKAIKKNTKKQKYTEVLVKEEHVYVYNPPVIAKDYVDIGVQADSTNTTALRWSALLTTDKELSTLTGVPNFEILRRIVEAVKMVYPEKRIIKNLDTRDKVIMTLMKLKHDIPYPVLSSLFKCARTALCRNIIYNTLTKLSNVLKHSIEFPTMEELSFNRPECFKDFENVRVVLHRVEITVQRPKNLCCQLALFSHHNNYIVKFMTGYTPAGLISFVSKAYSGRVSDNSIFEQSKIVERLGRGEAIMTAGNFTVESICSGHGVKLIRPISETGEPFQNEKIAKALVHIDEANQRLKTFQILNTRVPLSLIKKCEDIMIITAAIVNFR